MTRRLVDVSHIDTSDRAVRHHVEARRSCSRPSPARSAFHADGEVASARAAGARGHLLILSTGSTTSVEDVTSARGGPIWYQLYPTDTWRITQALVKRADAAGCPVLVLTVDLPAWIEIRETQARLASTTTNGNARRCHRPAGPDYLRRKPMFDGLDLSGVSPFDRSGLPGISCADLRDITKMKLVLKGIETREDAELSVQHGVDGDHRVEPRRASAGGWAIDHRMSPRSHRRRTRQDARARRRRVPPRYRRVQGPRARGQGGRGIGRPYIWGLAAFGQSGVDKVLDLLTRELALMMRHAGATSLRKLDRGFIVDARRQ